MKKVVYSFGNGTADGDGKMKDILGGKGAGLAEMCLAKLPVPPALPFPRKFAIFTSITTTPFRTRSISRCRKRSALCKSAWARSSATWKTRCW